MFGKNRQDNKGSSIFRNIPGEGYFVEKWVRGCAAQIGYFFGLPGLPMFPYFYLKIGLDIGRVFAKYIIFNEFFL